MNSNDKQNNNLRTEEITNLNREKNFSPQDEFAFMQNHCVLCGSPLDLKHTRIELHNEIKEEAHCPECTLKTRSKIYIIH